MPLIRVVPPPLPLSIWKRAPMLKFLLVSMAGIALAWTLRSAVSSWAWAMSSGVCIIASVLLYVAKHQPRHAVGGKLLPIAPLMALLTLSAAWLQLRYEQVCVKWPHEERIWLAEVNQITQRTANKTSLIATLQSDSSQYHHKKVLLQLYDSVSTQQAHALRSGDWLAIRGRMNHAQVARNPGDFDFATYLTLHGVSGSTWCDHERWQPLANKHTHSFSSMMLNKRQTLVNAYARYFDSADLAILSALTLGDKSMISANTRQLFSDTGTSHVLALSGLHLGILVSLFNVLLLQHLRRRSRRLFASLLLLALLWSFAFLAGCPVSLLRSVLMFSLLQISICLQRIQSTTTNSLVIAASIILAIDPLTLFDVGFQLSVTAVFSILLTNDYVWSRYRLPKFVGRYDLLPTAHDWRKKPAHSYHQYLKYVVLPRCMQRVQRIAYGFVQRVLLPFVCISLSAQWGTAPLVMHYFHTFAPYGFLANFVVIPSAYLLLGSSLLFLLFPLSCVQQTLAHFMMWVLHVLTQSLSHIAQWPGATWHSYVTGPTLVLVVAVPVLFFTFYESRRRKVRQFIMALFFTSLVIAVASEACVTFMQRITPRIVIYRVPQTTLIHFIVSSSHSYLYSSTSADSTRQRMHYIEQNYFIPHHIEWPQFVEQQRVQCSDFGRAGHLFYFAHQRLWLLNAHHQPLPPRHIDVLVVAKGSTSQQMQLLQRCNVTQVVLDASLSARLRSLWIEACQAAHIPCYDVSHEGAWQMKTSTFVRE